MITTTSANSICSTRRSTSVRLSSASRVSPRSLRKSLARIVGKEICRVDDRHHRVEPCDIRRARRPSRRGRKTSPQPAAARRCRCLRSAGSRSVRSAASRRTSLRRSSLSVQQMQPLVSSTSVSFVRERSAPPSRMRSASMLISLMSLTMTATRRPSRLRRTWFSTVVLPAPRKPASTVTGKRSSCPI